MEKLQKIINTNPEYSPEAARLQIASLVQKVQSHAVLLRVWSILERAWAAQIADE